MILPCILDKYSQLPNKLGILFCLKYDFLMIICVHPLSTSEISPTMILSVAFKIGIQAIIRLLGNLEENSLFFVDIMFCGLRLVS